MKRIFLTCLVMLIGLICTQPISAATTKKIAIYVEGELSKSEKNIATSAAMSRISGSKDYIPFERNEDFLNTLLKEQDYQLSGNVSEDEIRNIGARLGVDYVMIIQVITDDNSTYVSARLLNLESGQVIKSVSTDRNGTDIKTLKTLVTNVTYRLINKTSR